MPEQPQPTFRPFVEADVQVTAYVRKAAIEWLARDQGRVPRPWQPWLAGHFAHLASTDPEGSWVAEIGGLVVGYSQAFVRGDIWFLAQLFVQPEVHSSGVGRELLRLAQEYGRKRKVRVYSVVASSSPVAQSLYMRGGMFGMGTGYSLTGPVAPLLALPEPSSNRKRIVDCAGWLDRMDDLDREMFGAARRQDHEYYMHRTEVKVSSFGLSHDGVLEGYGYVDERDWIGPIVALAPEGQLPLLRMAAEQVAARGTEEATMWVLSLNHVLMRALLDAGWKSEPSTMLMASGPFAKFDRYHPSGGLLL